MRPHLWQSNGTYNFDLLAVLGLGDLGSALLVQVGGFDFVLELAKFRALRADFFDLPLFLLFLHFHARHLPRKVFFEVRHANLAVLANGPCTVGDSELLALSGVKRRLSKRHYLILKI